MGAPDATRNLYQRMLAAMNDVRYVQKTKGKDGELKFTIVTHDAVTALCREALIKNGVYAYPEITAREFTTFKSTQQRQGQTVEVEYAALTVELKMHFCNVDEPKDWLTVNSIGIGVDKIAQQDKVPGKAISYAVKYAYLKALALETGDDPDLEQHRGDEPEQPKPTDAAPPSPAVAALQPAEVSRVREMLQTTEIEIHKQLGVEEKAVRAELKRRLIELFGTSAPKELTVLKAGDAIMATWDYYRAQTQPSREATEA